VNIPLFSIATESDSPFLISEIMPSTFSAIITLSRTPLTVSRQLIIGIPAEKE